MIYLAGWPSIRTAAWAVSVVGLLLIFSSSCKALAGGAGLGRARRFPNRAKKLLRCWRKMA